MSRNYSRDLKVWISEFQCFLGSEEGEITLKLLAASKYYFILCINDLESGFVDVCLLDGEGLKEVKNADSIWAVRSPYAGSPGPSPRKIGVSEAAAAIHECCPHRFAVMLSALKMRLDSLTQETRPRQKIATAISLF